MFIYSHNFASQGAKDLAKEVGAKRIKHAGSKFRGSPNKVVINWGSSVLPEEVTKCRVLNSPKGVKLCTNKKTFFEALQKAGFKHMVPFTTKKNDVKQWLKEGATVVARTKLQGHSGEGIVIIDPVDEDIIDAPLYTRYVPKKDEYRVHVVDGKIADIQRKARKKDVPDDRVDWMIRNLDNGFIYARQQVKCPPIVTEVALDCMKHLPLDFGAIDIIYRAKKKEAFVLEINTAPGLCGETITTYSKALKELAQ